MKINSRGGHIGVQLIDAKLSVLSEYDGHFIDIYDHAVEKFSDNPQYPFLSTIDPYDDTFFNSVQVPLLINELLYFADTDNDSDFKEAVDKLIQYLGTVSTHRFIRFVGD